MAGILIVFGLFFAWGSYSLWALWTVYGAQVMAAIQSIGLPEWLTANIGGIIAIFFGLIVLSLGFAIVASMIARRLGGTLIYIGAFFLNVITLGIAIIPIILGVPISTAWPIFIPGIFTLLITLLLLTVFKDRVRRAGEIIKLTGQVTLDEKGTFVPPLLTMIFTLISAMMFGAIILQFTPVEVFLGTQELTIENGWPIGVGLVLFLFMTIFFYQFSYATTSGIVYIYMRGRDPTLGDGYRAALGVIGGIIVLSLASVVVVIIQMILRRIGREAGGVGAVVGGTAAGIVGWIWALINYFTIPAMVAEELGAKDGIKRSAGLVKNNFVDVIIKETAVRWAFGVLAFIFFIGFALAGAAIGWFFTGDLITTLIITVVFVIFSSIPSTLVLRTFDIVYVTLLYVFIRRQEGDFRETVIPAAMERELSNAYDSAQRSGPDL
ncbi:MAG: hypothetical protein JSW61_06330 [Candidatus Thorarchaeota archaeon]|nr:MAG: hypothetical protein JSW61_06330 [Candidatus Thorarchaeota archaeon]